MQEFNKPASASRILKVIEIYGPSGKEEPLERILTRVLNIDRTPTLALLWLLLHQADKNYAFCADLLWHYAAESDKVRRELKLLLPSVLAQSERFPIRNKALFLTLLNDLDIRLDRAQFEQLIPNPDELVRAGLDQIKSREPNNASILEFALSVPPLSRAQQEAEAFGDEDLFDDEAEEDEADEPILEYLRRMLQIFEVEPALHNRILPTILALMLLNRKLGGTTEGYEEIFEPLKDCRNGLARWYLRELMDMPNLSEERKLAEETDKHLASCGVLIEPPKLYSRFSHALVTTIDGCGSRTVAIFEKNDAGEMHCLNLMLNDEVGIKDVVTEFENAAEIESIWTANAEISVAHCDLQYARTLVADALYVHAQNGSAPHYRYPLSRIFLGIDPLVPKKRSPNLGTYMLELINPERVTLTWDKNDFLDELENSDYWVLFFSLDQMYAFAKKNKRRLKKKVLRQEALEEALREIAPLEKPRLISRLAVNLEVNAMRGQAGSKINREAALNWLVLKEGTMPLEQIPLVQALLELGMVQVQRAIEYGYNSQQEANQAAIEDEYYDQ